MWLRWACSFQGRWWDLFLCIGVTNAIFQSQSNFWSLREMLNIWASGKAREDAHFFRTMLGIPSGPVDSKELRPSKVILTTSGVNIWSKPDFIQLCLDFTRCYGILVIFNCKNWWEVEVEDVTYFGLRVRVPEGRAISNMLTRDCSFLLMYLWNLPVFLLRSRLSSRDA